VTELKRGTVINEKIRLVRPLGEGAMGTVWVAHHLALDTEVAVKFISRKMTADHPEVLGRFEMEAKATARIKSPHIVQVFDAGVAHGTPYIVMELLEGESLAARLERTGWLGFMQCEQVVSQVARALGRAHDLGVVHRDIKPENIFLCPSEDGIFVKLLDFGVAKAADIGARPGLTNPGVLVGTPEYMSREQLISSREVDHLADLWALAVLAYEMVTGDVPFTGETMALICMAICNGEHVPPSQLRKGVPAGLDDWFARAIRRDPAERFQTARELAVAFRAALLPNAFSFEDELSRETPIASLVDRQVKKPTRVGLGSHGNRVPVASTVREPLASEPSQPAPSSVAPSTSRSQPWPEEEAAGRLVAMPDHGSMPPTVDPAAPAPPRQRRFVAVALALGALCLLVVIGAVSFLGGPTPVPPSAAATPPVRAPERPATHAAPEAPISVASADANSVLAPEPSAAASSKPGKKRKTPEKSHDPSETRPDYGF
jgi:eukaryotic-like serine/threonine-protein kinase